MSFWLFEMTTFCNWKKYFGEQCNTSRHLKKWNGLHLHIRKICLERPFINGLQPARFKLINRLDQSAWTIDIGTDYAHPDKKRKLLESGKLKTAVAFFMMVVKPMSSYSSKTTNACFKWPNLKVHLSAHSATHTLFKVEHAVLKGAPSDSGRLNPALICLPMF